MSSQIEQKCSLRANGQHRLKSTTIQRRESQTEIRAMLSATKHYDKKSAINLTVQASQPT